MTDKTTIADISKTRAHRAARRLRNLGILAYWDKDAVALVAYVTKHGEEATRKAMYRALETPCQI